MKIKNFIIGIAIMILTSFVAIYGINTFYQEAPQYEKYCGNVTYPGFEINTSQLCTSYGGKWNPTYMDSRYPSPVKTGPEGYCDLTYYCNQQYTEESKIYSKNLFLITVPIGVILIGIGGALFALEAVGAGIMLGGIITLIYGATKYWANAGNPFRFGISLLGLIIVIAIAYWLNKKYENQSKKSKFSLKNLFKKKK
jgi:hypothetical protein